MIHASTAKALVEIDVERCKGCAVCAVVCPRGCIALEREAFNASGFHPARFSYQGLKGNCNACGLCYLVCPDYAVVTIKKLKKGVR